MIGPEQVGVLAAECGDVEDLDLALEQGSLVGVVLFEAFRGEHPALQLGDDVTVRVFDLLVPLGDRDEVVAGRTFAFDSAFLVGGRRRMCAWTRASPMTSSSSSTRTSASAVPAAPTIAGELSRAMIGGATRARTCSCQNTDSSRLMCSISVSSRSTVRVTNLFPPMSPATIAQPRHAGHRHRVLALQFCSSRDLVVGPVGGEIAAGVLGLKDYQAVVVGDDAVE